jgi:hypothetical protein
VDWLSQSAATNFVAGPRRRLQCNYRPSGKRITFLVKKDQHPDPVIGYIGNLEPVRDAIDVIVAVHRRSQAPAIFDPDYLPMKRVE